MDKYREAYNQGKEILPDYVYDAAFGASETDIEDAGQGALVKHLNPMLSLPTHFVDTTATTAEMLRSIGLPMTSGVEVKISAKLDGVPCSCWLSPTGWVQAVTRGKRFMGFRASNLVLGALPKPKKLPEQLIDIRGEFLIAYEDFDRLNASLPEHERYANPRSMVAGLMNSLEPNPDIVAALRWFAHGCYDGTAREHFDALADYLDSKNIAPYTKLTYDELPSRLDEVYEALTNLPVPCDGIVIQHRMTNEHNGRCNLDRVAIKRAADAKFSAETAVKAIEWRLANDGSYFPRLELEPVQINGSTVKFAAAYCWNYLERLGLSIGAKVIVTLRGGVIPYVSEVLAIGSGDYQFPEDAAEPQPGDMQLWSTNSADAVQRLRFIRGMTMLDLENCGIELFSDMYDFGIHSILELAKSIQDGSFERNMLSILPDTDASKAKLAVIRNRFETFNHVWMLLALRLPGIGFSAANAIGQHLSGYELRDPSALTKKAVKPVLADSELLEAVKALSKPVAPEHADLAIGASQASNKPKAIMSKRPGNGLSKAEFAKQFLADYDITENIKEASLLVCPAGETSNKIKYAQARNIEIKFYEDFA